MRRLALKIYYENNCVQDPFAFLVCAWCTHCLIFPTRAFLFIWTNLVFHRRMSAHCPALLCWGAPKPSAARPVSCMWQWTNWPLSECPWQSHSAALSADQENRAWECPVSPQRRHPKTLAGSAERREMMKEWLLFFCLSEPLTRRNSLNVLTASSPCVTTATDKGTVSSWTRAKRTPVLLDGRIFIFTSTFQLSEWPVYTCTKFHYVSKQNVYVSITSAFSWLNKWIIKWIKVFIISSK